MLLSLLSLPLLPAPLLTSPRLLVSAPGLALLTSGLLTLAAVWLTVSAVSVLQAPTLVTMIRSTEICLALVTEALYWGHAPHPISALGSLLVNIFLDLKLHINMFCQVMLCIGTMAAHDRIMDYVMKVKTKFYKKTLDIV